MGCADGLGAFEIRRIWTLGRLPSRRKPDWISVGEKFHISSSPRTGKSSETQAAGSGGRRRWLGRGLGCESPGCSRDLSGCFSTAGPGCWRGRAGCRLEIGAEQRTRMDRLVRDLGPSANILLGSSYTEPDITPLENRLELKTLSLRALGGRSLITACNRPTQFRLQRQK